MMQIYLIYTINQIPTQNLWDYIYTAYLYIVYLWKVLKALNLIVWHMLTFIHFTVFVVFPGEWAPPEIPGDVGAPQQAPFWESGVLWTDLAQQFTCTGCTAEVRCSFTCVKKEIRYSSITVT